MSASWEAAAPDKLGSKDGARRSLVASWLQSGLGLDLLSKEAMLLGAKASLTSTSPARSLGEAFLCLSSKGSVLPLALVHSSPQQSGRVDTPPCLTCLSAGEPLPGNSLDPFPSGPPLEGEQDRHRPWPRRTRKPPFPAYCYDKVLPCLLSREACCQCPSARVSTARGLATLSKEEGWLSTPLPWECASRFEGSLYWSGPAWLGLALLPCRSLQSVSVYQVGSRFGGYEVMECREGLTHQKGAF